jgi:sulfur carrier protein
MTDPITVHTDHGPLHLPAGSTVEQALATLLQGHDATARQGLATAVNGDFVPRHARAHTTLQHGDHLLCFSAITGG